MLRVRQRLASIRQAQSPTYAKEFFADNNWQSLQSRVQSLVNRLEEEVRAVILYTSCKCWISPSNFSRYVMWYLQNVVRKRH